MDIIIKYLIDTIGIKEFKHLIIRTNLTYYLVCIILFFSDCNI